MMMKKFITTFTLFSFIMLFVSACGVSTPTSTGNNVHMNELNFAQNAISIKKGESITLIDDVAVVHIIQNGTWDNGIAKPGVEPGAPTVQLQFQGNDSHNAGPFNTAGTYHLYCTVHPGMNLTVTVQ